jgi:chromate transporter
MLSLVNASIDRARLSPSQPLQVQPQAGLTPLAAKETTAPAAATPPKGLSQGELFVAFFKAGLAFGGGLGIMAALEKELVVRKQVVTREDFLATYSLARLVPSGTMSAMAVAYGRRFGGWSGSAIALTAMVLPSAALTVLLTVAYQALAKSPALGLMSSTVLPASVAFIVLAALKFGKTVCKPSAELAIAVAAFGATVVFDLHPALILLGGALTGLLAWRYRGDTHKTGG